MGKTVQFRRLRREPRVLGPWGSAKARSWGGARRRRRSFTLVEQIFAVGLAAFIVVFAAAPTLRDWLPAETREGTAVSARFGLCGSGARHNCVVDGDTLHVGGETIRIADIDTPEVFSPGCESELALGRAATEHLLRLVNAGPFEVEGYGSRDQDVYGRKLRVLTRNGRSLGEALVAEGLARRWDGARRGWCA